MSWFDHGEHIPHTAVSDATVRVVPLFRDIRLADASGFIATDAEKQHFLVTNRHVVRGRHNQTNHCVSTTCAIPDRIEVTVHTQEDEVASPKAFTFEVPLYDDPEHMESPRWREERLDFEDEQKLSDEFADVVCLPFECPENCLIYPLSSKGSEFFGDIPVAVSSGSRVVVSGFPFGFSATGLRNQDLALPVWITGYVATPIDWWFDRLPVFLIDARTRPSMSGSPVFAFYDQEPPKIPKREFQLAPESGFRFLGVYSGRLRDDSDLGRVWQPSLVHRLLNRT